MTSGGCKGFQVDDFGRHPDQLAMNQKLSYTINFFCLKTKCYVMQLVQIGYI